MDGYVIASGFSEKTGSIKMFLNRKRQWQFKVPTEAYVFSPDEMREILETAESNRWNPMPEYIIAAEYVEKTDSTKIVGTIQPAYAVSPVNIE